MSESQVMEIFDIDEDFDIGSYGERESDTFYNFDKIVRDRYTKRYEYLRDNGYFDN